MCKNANDSFIYDNKTDQLSLTCMSDCAAGSEIFVCYGSYTNTKLLHTVFKLELH